MNVTRRTSKQNQLNIYNLQNYEFLAKFVNGKKIVKFVKF